MSTGATSGLQVTPTPTDEEAAAIVAAIQLGLPSAGDAGPAQAPLAVCARDGYQRRLTEMIRTCGPPSAPRTNYAR